MITNTNPRIVGFLPQLRDALVEAGYSEGGIRDRLALPAASPLPPVGHAPSIVRLALGAQDTLGTLIRLLLLGRPTDVDDVGQLATPLIDMLTSTGLAGGAGGSLRPMVRVTPFHELLVAGDLHNEDSADVASDAVENPHGPTEVLARLIPRAAVHRSLDIGTGSGTHALQLASHSQAVLGLDISPRAVAFARFNAALNGITNARFQVADVVSGLDNEEPFELIVSNPPYLVSPETSITYRDGQPGSAHVGTRVLIEAPALLAPDGLLVCLTSWGAADPHDPVREIMDLARQAGCNGLVLLYALRTQVDDAIRWNVHRGDADQIQQTAARWLDHYGQHAIGDLAYGIVVFSLARGRQPWFRSERVTLAGQAFDRSQLRDVMSALEQTHRGHTPQGLRPHPDHEIESTGKIADGKIVLRDQFLCSTRGIRFAANCGPQLLQAITTKTVAPYPGPGADVMADMVRRLYEFGLIVGDGGSDGR